jgi:hypothetical protein
MLELLENRRTVNGWHKPLAAAPEKILTFELLPNRISSNSATFSLYRAKVPGGWLVASRPHDTVLFIPDPHHDWDGGSVG